VFSGEFVKGLDLLIPPSNQLEPLKGRSAGTTQHTYQQAVAGLFQVEGRGFFRRRDCGLPLRCLERVLEHGNEEASSGASGRYFAA
jgi:hypothetical protein